MWTLWKLESNEKVGTETKPLDNTPVVVEVMKPPEEVLVNTTAVFDRSLTHSMTSSDSVFLEQILLREDYLRQNISKLEFGQQFGSQNFGLNECKHSIEIRIFVKTQKFHVLTNIFLYEALGLIFLLPTFYGFPLMLSRWFPQKILPNLI